PLDGIRNSLPFDILTIHEDGSFELSERRISMQMQEYVSALCRTTQYTEAKVWTKVITRELLTSREHLTFFLRFAEDYAGRIGDPMRPFSVETWEKAYAEWECVNGDGSV
ncbi:MAG: hypothetical protein J5825_03075, partial [Lachnospiraceae bacterium]|nr:hypothetical protein [Lachnospiraceae bacterium]